MGIFARKTTQKKATTAPVRPSEALVALSDPKSPIAEAYRTVRTNLQFMNLDQSKKCFLVTSAGPGEGKSTTVANLGVTMAMAGNRTLLVDTDLRRPILHKLFAIPNTVGLTSVLAGQAKVESAIQSGRLANLYFLTSGPLPPNPAEILMAPPMADFLEFARANYDVVILDSPPVISVSDALVLGSLADGVVLVIRSGQYPYGFIRQAKSQLEGVKATLLGTVLNSVDFKHDGYYYYQYYYYHYYGYSYGSDTKK